MNRQQASLEYFRKIHDLLCWIAVFSVLFKSVCGLNNISNNSELPHKASAANLECNFVISWSIRRAHWHLKSTAIHLFDVNLARNIFVSLRICGYEAQSILGKYVNFLAVEAGLFASGSTVDICESLRIAHILYYTGNSCYDKIRV